MIARRVLAAGVLILALAAQAQAQARLSADQMRGAAFAVLQDGDPALARTMAEALLHRDPEDRVALRIALEAALATEDFDGAVALGRRLWQVGETRPERHFAARATALALARTERHTRAQLWLRRAATVAPDDAALAQTRSDFRGLRSVNPWQVSLQFSLAQSDNVNGGSEDIFNIIDGLPLVGVLSGDARALSGLVGTADLRFSRRLAGTADWQARLGGRLYLRRVRLSSEAEDIAPDSRNADFGSTLAEIDLTHARRLGEGIGEAQLRFGGSWFAEELDYSFARLAIAHRGPLGPELGYRVSAHVERRWPGDDSGPEEFARGIDGALTYALASGARFSANLALAELASDGPNARLRNATGQLSWQPAEPLGPADLRLSVGASYADYPDYTIILPVPGGRQDRRLFGSLEASFPDMQYAGFAPVLTLSAQRTESNVSRFERSELSLRVSFRSTF